MSVQKTHRWRLWSLGGAICLIGIAWAVARSPRFAASQRPGAQKASTAGMVWIAGGEFSMGTDDPESEENERPARRVKVEGFWIDEHDVTNAEFERFVRDTGYVTVAERPVDWEQLKLQLPPGTPKPDEEALKPGSLVYSPTDHPVPFDDLSAWWKWVPGASWRHPQGPGSGIEAKQECPVVQVSWDDAVAYAAWAGRRLPTEAEWEFAARGGLKKKKFVWGDEFSPGGKMMANTYQGQFPVKDLAQDGYAGVSPVHAFPANGYGLYDMAGNVWQWTADVYEESPGAQPCVLCAGSSRRVNGILLADEVRRVVKGGSFLCSYQYCEGYRPSARRGTPLDTGSEHVGFRCAMSK